MNVAELAGLHGTVEPAELLPSAPPVPVDAFDLLQESEHLWSPDLTAALRCDGSPDSRHRRRLVLEALHAYDRLRSEQAPGADPLTVFRRWPTCTLVAVVALAAGSGDEKTFPAALTHFLTEQDNDAADAESKTWLPGWAECWSNLIGSSIDRAQDEPCIPHEIPGLSILLTATGLTGSTTDGPLLKLDIEHGTVVVEVVGNSPRDWSVRAGHTPCPRHLNTWVVPAPLPAVDCWSHTGRAHQIPVVDPADPLLVFDRDGNLLPEHQPLPGEVWVLHRGEMPPEAFSGQVHVLEVSPPPPGWSGWWLARLVLLEGSAIRSVPNPDGAVFGAWRSPASTGVPELEFGPPITALVADDGSPVYAQIPRLPFPTDTVDSWQVEVSQDAPDKSWALLQELVRTLCLQGVIDMPEGVAPEDEAFAPRRGPVYMCGDGSESRKKVLSWLPTAGSNTRDDYLARVLRALGSPVSSKTLLDGLWRDLDPSRPGDGPHTWFRSDTLPRIGTVRRINHRKIRIRPVGEAERLFQCDRCRRITAVSVRAICSTLRCDGKLHPWYRPAAEAEHNHYRDIYLSSAPIPMSVQEHTAQWTSEKAAEIQGQFVRGEVNALSCSTTFELGVDVGELQAGVLRNMPPTTANYVQRAGRAGRRSDSAALVVTFAQRRSHDLTRFSEPEKMISGETRAPSVPLENVRIDRRHVHSVALAAFFRAMKEQRRTEWRTAGEFFLPPDPAPSDHVIPTSLVRDFLTPAPRRSGTASMPCSPRESGRRSGSTTAAGSMSLSGCSTTPVPNSRRTWTPSTCAGRRRSTSENTGSPSSARK